MKILSTAFRAGIAIIAMTAAISPACAQKSDTGPAIVANLLRTDQILSRVFGDCKGLVAVPESVGTHDRRFTLHGTCPIRDNPEEDSDCPAYRVDGAGEVGNGPDSTVLRTVSFNRVCSTEGH